VTLMTDNISSGYIIFPAILVCNKITIELLSFLAQ